MLLSLGQPPWIPGAVVIPPSPTAGQCEAPNIGFAAGEAGSCDARARELGRFVMFLSPVHNAVHPLGKLICPGIFPTLYLIVGRVLVDRVVRLLSRRSALLRSYTVMASVGIFRRHTTSSGKHGLERQRPLGMEQAFAELLALGITAVIIGISYSPSLQEQDK